MRCRLWVEGMGSLAQGMQNAASCALRSFLAAVQWTMAMASCRCSSLVLFCNTLPSATCSAGCYHVMSALVQKCKGMLHEAPLITTASAHFMMCPQGDGGASRGAGVAGGGAVQHCRHRHLHLGAVA